MDETKEHGLRRMGALFDITERKRAQYELDRQRDELAHAHDEQGLHHAPGHAAVNTKSEAVIGMPRMVN